MLFGIRHIPTNRQNDDDAGWYQESILQGGWGGTFCRGTGNASGYSRRMRMVRDKPMTGAQLNDQGSYPDWYTWGSGFGSGVLFTFADGSVRNVSYSASSARSACA